MSRSKADVGRRNFLKFLRDAPSDMPARSAGVLLDKDAADIHPFLRALAGARTRRTFRCSIRKTET